MVTHLKLETEYEIARNKQLPSHCVLKSFDGLPSYCGIGETLTGLTLDSKLSNEQHADCSFVLQGTKRNVTFDREFSLADTLL